MSDENVPAPAEPDEKAVKLRGWRRDREASRLAAIGHSPEEIAEMLNLTDSSGEYDSGKAVSAIRRGLTAVYRLTTDEMRLAELSSLDEMERHLWQSLRREHVLVQQGRVIMVEGQMVQDERFALEALDRILKIKERRAKYLGLDAQVRISVEADQIGGEIASLIAMINATEDATRNALPSPVEETE
jgi:hypothetical protein